jgi:heptosyltransferase-3
MKTWMIRSALDLAYGRPREVNGDFNPASVKKILLIRRNGFGDMICALPLIRNIRAAWPKVQMDVLASERNACIVSNLNLVDRIHFYTRGNGLMRNHYLNLRSVLKPIFEEDYDLLICIKGGFSSLLAVISYATRIPWRLGYVPSRGHKIDFCFNLKIELPVEREHQIESCLRFLEPLKIPRTSCDLSIRIEPQHAAFAHEVVSASHVERNRFALINVSSERVESRWTDRALIETSNGLFQQFGLPVILSGLPRDRELLEHVQMTANKSVRAICQPPDIHHFAALTRASKFLLCGDGGPMHVAASVGRPVFVLFSATDPTIWRPYNVPFAYLQKGRFVAEITSGEVLGKMKDWLPTLT